ETDFGENSMLAPSTFDGTTSSPNTSAPGEKTVYTKGAGTTSVNNENNVYIAIKITFVNTDTDQNVYKNFGKTAGDGAPKCSRTINILYN
ncbi:MAG: hypothetical protein IJR61_07500, partial [Clostridia bacterium]|nr:hypothetical protein [Clostridia bacterium]